MKKVIHKYRVMLCIILFLAASFFWWTAPRNCLSARQAEEISYIEIAYGTNGEMRKIDDKEQINLIVDALIETKIQKRKLSIGYAGTGVCLVFFDTKQKEIERFFINSGTTLRKDPFFYRDTTGELEICYQYLMEISPTVR